MKRASTHTAKAANTALGTIRSLEYTVQNLDESAAALTRNIADTQKRLTDLQEQVDTPFEYADKLASVTKRQQQIIEALDLNKNQAPNQLDAQANEVAEETIQQVETPAKKLDQRNGLEITTANHSTAETSSHRKRQRVRA